MQTKITADILLRAYGLGIFPMAESRDTPEIHWVDPRDRGVFELHDFHISRSLKREIIGETFQIRTDSDFIGTVLGCADRPETWINAEILALYEELFQRGHAHSLEVWQSDVLVGGVYGVTLGAAFFGESMFSRRPNASKVALAWLMHRLRAGGFRLFDTQFLTPHLASLGAQEIPRAVYRQRLAEALQFTATFTPEGYHPSAGAVISSSISGTSSITGTSGVTQCNGQTS